MLKSIRTSLAISALAVTQVPLITVGSVYAVPRNTQRIVSNMRVVRFDPKVATTNGYEIRTLPDGKQYSVKKGAQLSPKSTQVSSQGYGVVGGNCGSSWISFTAVGNLEGVVSTGFDVIRPAVEYAWRVDVTDQIGVGTLNWGGGLLFRESWVGTARTRSGATGSAFARVNSPASFAVLTNGAVCYSGGPSASTYYY